MKHRLTALLLVLLLLLTMTGCSAANAVQTLDAAEDKVEAKLDAVEDSMESAVQKALTPTTAPTKPAPVATAPAQPEPAATQSFLTGEEAEKIALGYVGFTADQVQRLRSEFEIDDGIPQYDVEFHKDRMEYEFEIHADDGRILSYDKDRDD